MIFIYLETTKFVGPKPNKSFKDATVPGNLLNVDFTTSWSTTASDSRTAADEYD